MAKWDKSQREVGVRRERLDWLLIANLEDEEYNEPEANSLQKMKMSAIGFALKYTDESKNF